MSNLTRLFSIPVTTLVVVILTVPTHARADSNLAAKGKGIYEVGPFPDISAEELRETALEFLKEKNPTGYNALQAAKKTNPVAAAKQEDQFLQKFREELYLSVEKDGYKAAYVCDVIRFLGADITRSSCKPGVMRGDNEYLLEPPQIVVDAIAKKYSESDMKISFWMKNGRWIMLAAILFFVVFAIIKKSKKRRPETVFADGGGQVGGGFAVPPAAAPPDAPDLVANPEPDPPTEV